MCATRRHARPEAPKRAEEHTHTRTRTCTHLEAHARTKHAQCERSPPARAATNRPTARARDGVSRIGAPVTRSGAWTAERPIEHIIDAGTEPRHGGRGGRRALDSYSFARYPPRTAPNVGTLTRSIGAVAVRETAPATAAERVAVGGVRPCVRACVRPMGRTLRGAAASARGKRTGPARAARRGAWAVDTQEPLLPPPASRRRPSSRCARGAPTSGRAACEHTFTFQQPGRAPATCAAIARRTRARRPLAYSTVLRQPC